MSKIFLFSHLIIAVVLTACQPTTTPPVAEPCGSSTQGITLLPTSEPNEDPDLTGENPQDYVYAQDCDTAIDPTKEPTESVVHMGQMQNVTLDSHDAHIESVAASAHMTAVAWTQDGGVYVGISRGQGGFEIDRVDDGSHPDLAISSADRLHLVYEKQGALYYRTADGDAHPADNEFTVFGILGTEPQIAVDLSNWAHIVYKSLGQPNHIIHMGGDNWFSVPLPAANDFSLTSTGESLQLLLTTDSEVQLLNMFLTENPVYQWTMRASWPLEGQLQGAAQIAYNKPVDVVNYTDYDGSEPYWLAVSWVERFEDTVPPEQDTLIPTYEIVNPLSPDQLGNPDQLAHGMNATRWHGNNHPYDAGLMQTIPVNSDSLRVQAQTRAIFSNGALAQLRMGIDPNGGVDPFSSSVVWSSPVVNPDAFTPVAVEVPVSGTSVTLFLRATQAVLDEQALAIFDNVEITGGAGIIQNASFENGFNAQGVVANVPEGWTAFYDDTYTSDIDSGAVPRDVYRVYGAWSSDRGVSWSGKETITENRELAAGTTGALRPTVYPAILTSTEPDEITFFYVYASGDPPADTTFLRYGRPYLTRCEAGTTDCTDMPGEPLFARDQIRPTTNLIAVSDHDSGDGHVVLVWDTLQTDYESKDVHMTLVSLTD